MAAGYEVTLGRVREGKREATVVRQGEEMQRQIEPPARRSCGDRAGGARGLQLGKLRGQGDLRRRLQIILGKIDAALARGAARVSSARPITVWVVFASLLLASILVDE